MKRIAIIFILLFTSVSVLAQTDSSGFFVLSFKKLDWDLDARSNYPVLDQNNRKAALIKVVIPEVGFDFDVGIMGVVDVKQEVGEIWVYVPEGVRKITIRHQTFGIIRDYEFGCPIESASVYEMRLHVPPKPINTVIIKDSIVYVPAPVNSKDSHERKRIGASILAVSSVPDHSFGFMVVWNPQRFGAYVKAVGNLKPSSFDYICHEDGTADNGYIWTSGKSHISRMAITTGGIFKYTNWLSISSGIGYGRRILLWEDTKGNQAKVDEASVQGIVADFGTFFHFGRFTAYAGVCTIAFKRLYTELGVGFSF